MQREWIWRRPCLRPGPCDHLRSACCAERPREVLLAEQQWEIAMEFDRRYADPQWVQQQKHWPPRALAALERFLRLS